MFLFILSCNNNVSAIKDPFSVTLINQNPVNKIMIFSHHLDLSQFNIEYWSDWINNEYPDEFELPDFLPDTTNIYKISNPSIFGVDCHLIYDDNYKILTGYSITTAHEPNGTGEGCSPLFINSIISVDNQYLSDDLSVNLITENTWDDPPYCNPPSPCFSLGLPGVVPNPYIPNNYFSETDYINPIRFTGLPESSTINILNGNQEIISSISSDNDNAWWFLEDEFNNTVDSGIYIYQVLNNDNQSIIQGSLILINTTIR